MLCLAEPGRGGEQRLWGFLDLLQRKPEPPEKVQASCCENQGLSASFQWPCAPSCQIMGALGAGGFEFKASSVTSSESESQFPCLQPGTIPNFVGCYHGQMK